MPTRFLMGPDPVQSGSDDPHGISSRHFLKLVEDTAEVGFWSTDLRDERMNASVGLYGILGLHPSVELTFGLFAQMIHPDDRNGQADPLTLLRAGQPVRQTFRIIRPDRTQRWIAGRAEALLGDDSRPSMAIGIVQDATGRHEAHLAVEQCQDRLDGLIVATGAVVWIATAEGAAVETPHWQALTGQDQSASEGAGWLDAVHPDDRARVSQAWQDALAGGVLYNTDYRILCVDGAYRWVNARGVPIRGRDGTVREWIGACLGAAEPDLLAAASSPRTITAAQIRAARGMACLSAEELARRAQVSVSTVRRLEDGNATVQPRADTVTAVREVLEQTGLVFTFDASGKPGVREA